MKTIYSICFSFAAIFCFSQSPTVIWQKMYGGTNGDCAYSVENTLDNGYIAAGSSKSNNGNVTINNGSEDFWVIKTDIDGNLLWQRSYGGSNVEIAKSISPTTDKGYIVVGFSASTDGDVTNHIDTLGNKDFWVLKLDSIGNIQWKKCYGGTSHDIAYSVIQCKDKGYAIAGELNMDYGIIKLDSSGTLQWQKTYGGTGQDMAKSIRQTSDKGFLVFGTAGSNDGDVLFSHGYEDAWLVKLDSLGNLSWSHAYGSSGGDEGTTIELTTDGGFILGATTIKPDGDVPPFQIVSYNFGPTPGHPWMMKFNSSYNLVWQKVFYLGTLTALRQTNYGGYVFASNITQTIVNQPGFVYHYHRYSHYYYLNSLGDSIARFYITSSNISNEIHGIASNPLNGGYVFGGFQDTQAIDYTYYPGSYADLRLFKVDSFNIGNVTAINEIGRSRQFSVYPNPTCDFVKIDSDILFEDVAVSIVDVMGREVSTIKISNTNNKVYLHDLSSGIYFLKINGSNNGSYKIMKQ